MNIEKIKEIRNEIEILRKKMEELSWIYTNNCPPCCNKKCQFCVGIFEDNWAPLNCRCDDYFFVTDCPDYMPCEVKNARDK